MKTIRILSILLLCVVVLSCDDKKKGKVVCYYPQVSHYEVEYYKDSMVITEIGKEGGNEHRQVLYYRDGELYNKKDNSLYFSTKRDTVIRDYRNVTQQYQIRLYKYNDSLYCRLLDNINVAGEDIPISMILYDKNYHIYSLMYFGVDIYNENNKPVFPDRKWKPMNYKSKEKV